MYEPAPAPAQPFPGWHVQVVEPGEQASSVVASHLQGALCTPGISTCGLLVPGKSAFIYSDILIQYTCFTTLF